LQVQQSTEAALRGFYGARRVAQEASVRLGKAHLACPMRSALTGNSVSPISGGAGAPDQTFARLAHSLDRLGIAYSWHKVVPFVADLISEPEARNPKAVVMFGAYTLWRYARAKGLSPGVFTIRPFVEEAPWAVYLLNGPGAKFCTAREIAEGFADDGRLWFLRPVADGKEQAGKACPASEIIEIARKVMTLDARMAFLVHQNVSAYDWGDGMEDWALD
jgi:hypothetical protein